MTGLDLDIRLQKPGFDLDIRRSLPLTGLTAIFGPSGAGKSTLLRIIAGFERASGCISFAGEVWQDGRRFVPPHRRRVATVFQQPRLFDHLDVAGNLAYAARRAGQSGTMADMIERFALGPLLRRRTATLSGGEAQRVALARALLTAPRLILMDEPVAAVDLGRRDEILPLVEALRDEARIPVLYVSHSLTEVARLSTQVLTLAAGKATALGPSDEILATITATPALSGEEAGSLLPARVHGPAGDGLTELHFPGGTILTPDRPGPPGTEVRLFVRARDVMIALAPPEGLSALNILPATVSSMQPAGPAAVNVVLSCGGVAISARITARSARVLALAPGSTCYAILKSVALARD